jgi:LmbE family N-acetylglucosaminyl deacetylase
MATGRLLISYAHPDDESFGLGALIAKYVARGVEVYLICATNGDVGTVRPELMNGYSSVAELRLAELDAAAKLLGLKEVILLGYRDSGMMGSESSKDPACLWQQPQSEVTRRVVEVMRDVQPQVVITFNRYGGYGHPDHIAIQRATVDAFALAGDPLYETGQPPYRPQKLYFSSIPKRQMQLGIWWLKARGQDPRRMGRNRDIDVQAILDHAEPVHAMVDIHAYYPQWEAASSCHQSQLGGRSTPRLPPRIRYRVFGRQGFTRVVPKPLVDRVDETDLFANVVLDERRPVQIPEAAASTS